MCKFLAQYQQLWTPKIGDRVKIVQLLDSTRLPVVEWHYNLGEIGIIQSNDPITLPGSDITEYMYMVEINEKVFGMFREEFEYYYE